MSSLDPLNQSGGYMIPQKFERSWVFYSYPVLIERIPEKELTRETNNFPKELRLYDAPPGATNSSLVFFI